MTESKNPPANAPAVDTPHDRVEMLSLHADGTPAQLNPELIGDRDATLDATRKQFQEQAVSAVDQAERRSFPSGVAEDLEQDPAIAALQKKHEAAEKSAASAAEAAVKSLHQGK